MLKFILLLIFKDIFKIILLLANVFLKKNFILIKKYLIFKLILTISLKFSKINRRV